MTDKELKNIAPLLYQLKKMGSGFSVPKNYFETVETTIGFDIFSANKEQVFKTPENYFETIEDSVLNHIHKTDAAFSIPEGYFDTIEDNVLEKINKEHKVISLKNRIVKQFIPFIAAASLLLFISLQFFNTHDTDLFASLETSEIENWIENDELGLNSYEIASLYDDIDIENLDINSLYDDDEMLNYLNEVDVESLILTN
ncbi:MAG: hypothetical protein ACI89R_001158 [Candidatus Azotimanducaceae bacterium]|jgi:hypothetical protein